MCGILGGMPPSKGLYLSSDAIFVTGVEIHDCPRD